MYLERLRELYQNAAIKWSKHCLERMQERDINRADVKNCVMNGEIIEDYPDDYPHPSCLILGCTINNKPLHVVVGMDADNIYVITAYFPSIEKFENDFKIRRRR